jgi:hypothetical protein
MYTQAGHVSDVYVCMHACMYACMYVCMHANLGKVPKACTREIHLPAVNASPASIKKAELAAELAAGVEVRLFKADDPAYAFSGAGSIAQNNCTCNEGYTGPDGSECEACEAGASKT